MTVRVLVIDDSAAMRRLLSVVLNAESDIEVVGEAANAVEARHALATLQPDVATLDLEMPGTGGLELLDEIMHRRSLPVVVVAARTDARTRAKAMAAGAFDVLDKPGSGGTEGRDFTPLIQRIKAAGRQGLRSRPSASTAAPARTKPQRSVSHVVGIGGSAGAIEALTAMLAKLPANGAPVLIVQHIPPNFVAQLAERLDKVCAASVEVAQEGGAVENGKIYLAPGDRHLCLHKGGLGWRLRLDRRDPVHGFRPSIDVLFASLARAAGNRSVGVILSGMGRDGVDGLLALRQAGGRTLGQDSASIVYGMPKSAHEAGAVELQGSPERLADHIQRLCGREQTEAR